MIKYIISKYVFNFATIFCDKLPYFLYYLKMILHFLFFIKIGKANNIIFIILIIKYL